MRRAVLLILIGLGFGAGLSCFQQELGFGPGDPVVVLVSPDTVLLRLGDQRRMTAAPLDSTKAFLPGFKATWTSSAPNIASVDQNGVVTGLAAGTAKITAAIGAIQGEATIVVDLPPAIGASRNSVPLAAVAGNDAQPDSVVIDNAGGFSLIGLSLAATAYDSGAADWLAAALSADAAPATLVITPSTAAITTAGTYRAVIPVQSVDATNTPFGVEVILTIAADAPTTAAVATGNAQTGPAGAPLGVPPSVHVQDQYGNGVPGVAVLFTVIAGGGSVTGASQTTGDDGHATVGSWTLGTGLGENRLEATFPAAGLPPVTFTANAAPAAPAVVLKVEGDGQSAVAGSDVPIDPAVRVEDQFGNPVGGVTVNFSVTGGGGAITGGAQTTGADGRAQVGSWTLGTIAGPNSLRAAAAGVPATVTFAATGIAGPPTSMSIVAGNGQTATVNTNVAVAPAVRLRDVNTNPVPGVQVDFVAQSGGSVTGGSPSTGADGIATVGSWKLGTGFGPQQLVATAAGLGINGNPATFDATALADQAFQITVQAGDGQSATAGTQVAVPPSALVSDQFGNPVSGIQVTFAVTSGGGSITGAVQTTNAQGIATVGSWTLGTTVGSNTLAATTAPTLVNSPLPFTATGISGAAQKLVYVSGDVQTDTIGATLQPYVVQVRDANDNGVQGVPVAFTPTGGGGSITSSVTTDANGMAGALRVLSTTVGAHTAQAAVGGLQGSPVSFTATATHGRPASVEMVAGNGQTAQVNTAVATAPSVRVRDRGTNLVQGAAVNFVPGGGGSVSGGSQTTGSTGVATVTSWTLGTTAGSNNNTLTATVTGTGITNNPQVFTASATPGPANSTQTTIAVDDNNIQASNTGGATDFRSVVTVTVRDQFNNVRQGDLVTFTPSGTPNFWRVSTTDATISNSVTTNASGVASRVFYSTLAELKTLNASVSGSFSKQVSVTVVPAAANATQTLIAVDDNNIQASNTGGAADFRSVVTVTVRDQYDNARQGDLVTFTPSGTPNFWRVSTTDATISNSVTTNASGVASRVFYSTLAEGKTLNASVSGSFNKQVGITVRAAAASSMAIFAGNGQTAVTGTAVATAPAVRVTDPYANPVNLQVVSFVATSGGGMVSGGSQFTNTNGVATVTSWTLGNANAPNSIGQMSNTLQASSSGLTSVNFSANAIYSFATHVTPRLGGCTGCHNYSFTWSALVPETGISDCGSSLGCSGTNQRHWPRSTCGQLVVESPTGSSASSLLMRKLDWNQPSGCGATMPYGSPTQMADADRTVIRAWINNGAPNN